MKIAIAQINPTIGDFKGNSRKIFSAIDHAAKENVELVVFSEMAVSGYPCLDLLDNPEFVKQNHLATQNIIAHSLGPAVLLGHFDASDKPQGKAMVNAATLFQNGLTLFETHKTLLPNYDVFDESRYFEPGDKLNLFEFKNQTLCISICEDIWNNPEFADHDVYAHDPFTDFNEDTIDILINLSASPYRAKRLDTRLSLARSLCQRLKTCFVLVNQVGGNDEIIFDGQSFVMNHAGELLTVSKAFEEDLSITDLTQNKAINSHPQYSDEEEVFLALKIGLRDYFKKCGFNQALIGLSGGIDSSLVAVIAKEALGADNVIGVRMPSPYTSDASMEDAELLAKHLDLRLETIPIDNSYQSLKNDLKLLFKDSPEDLTEENLQARLRGNLLMALSNKWGALVLSTGNKSEMAVGYCTLYGDMAGGLSVIADLYKTQVYELANWINRDTEIIPKRVITRPPTAELRPDQTDQDSLPPYEKLDPLLKDYIEERMSAKDLIAKGHEKSRVRKILSLVDKNEYKRRQAAPVLRVSKKSFGIGRRLPLAQRFDSSI